MKAQPVFTYLVNTMRSGDREVPYSLVTATDLSVVAHGFSPAPSDSTASPPIILNDWAARDLRVQAGDPLTLEYYVWEEPGRLLTRTTAFHVSAVVPAGQGADHVST